MPSTIEKKTLPDGVELAYRLWRSPEPRGLVVGVHGMRSHSGWYEWSGDYLAARGFTVCFPDRRGSGLNRQVQGITTQRLMADLEHFITGVRQDYPGLPVHVEAISWGGKLAVVTLARDFVKADSLILVTPGIAARRDLSAAAKLKVLTGHFFARPQRMPVPLQEPELFTADPHWREYIRRDELGLTVAPVDLLWASHMLDRKLKKAVRNLNTPLFLLLAGKDEICDNEGLTRFYNEAGSARKQVKVYNEAQHTLEFEPNREEIFRDVVGWLLRTGKTR